MSAGLKIQPFTEAVQKIAAKTALGSRLRSDEWDLVPLAIRERAFFSARVESVRLLSDMQRSITDALAGNSTPGGAIMSRDRFISDMRKVAQELGVGQLGKAEITDLQGPKRLGLIYDMQTRQARAYAKWKIDQDPDFLNEWPAQRLIRLQDRKEPRDWEERWAAAATAVAFEGVASAGMIALKSSPIWYELSRFGTPWPPFDYESGMGLQDISRNEAERLGLVQPEDKLVPDGEATFNQSLEASTRGMSEDFIPMLTKLGLTIINSKLVPAPKKITNPKYKKKPDDKLKNFDPDQPRAPDGKWTDVDGFPVQTVDSKSMDEEHGPHVMGNFNRSTGIIQVRDNLPEDMDRDSVIRHEVMGAKFYAFKNKNRVAFDRYFYGQNKNDLNAERYSPTEYTDQMWAKVPDDVDVGGGRALFELAVQETISEIARIGGPFPETPEIYRQLFETVNAAR
jgi:hypothetical protein